MSQKEEQNLFFLNLPDLRKLCCVTLSLPCGCDVGELRNTQVKSCRELLSLYPDILASPALETFGEITVIMAITFFKTGIIQAYTQRHGLQMGVPQRVLPITLQVCLSYTLTVKLAPNWNKVGQFLVAGMDFLSCSGKLNAVAMQLSVSESQLCLSVEANTVRLPPATLEDFDIAPNEMRSFHNSREAVIHSFSLPSNWCYILPSMKRGQIISISHQMPTECPFQSYADIRKHWSSLYGYRLPRVDEQDVTYCSVYFKLVGERLFTYPLCCIRALPIQRFPRIDLQGALSSFLLDLRPNLQSVCGFTIRMTSKPCYPTTSLTTTSSQGSCSKPVNLKSRSSSRPVLTQLPPSLPRNAPFGGAAEGRCPSQPGGRSISHQYSGGEAEAPLTDTTPKNGPDSTSASAFTPTPAPAHRIVPIFRNKALERHVNVTKILAERRQQRREEGLHHLLGSDRPAPGPAFSSKRKADACLGVGQSLPGPASHPRVGSPSCLQGHNSVGVGRDHEPRGTVPQFPAMKTEIPAAIPSSAGGDWFQSKPKKPKVSVVEVDVEHYARSHQLSKINAATLQAWLRGRGVPVRSKDRKEELVAKVMHCLSEL
ncbi:uncharacterized protein C18orf63-like [Conger conger]|uniref:uncharacterized protein C18orf63-like n=1 Tax=Conger conger TaxID=82655 RepID=UPI002A5A0EEA|nr:uncharacterized protein C18orf63-like [Conger conger]